MFEFTFLWPFQSLALVQRSSEGRKEGEAPEAVEFHEHPQS
jgi:hypothetical protein